MTRAITLGTMAGLFAGLTNMALFSLAGAVVALGWNRA